MAPIAGTYASMLCVHVCFQTRTPTDRYDQHPKKEIAQERARESRRAKTRIYLRSRRSSFIFWTINFLPQEIKFIRLRLICNWARVKWAKQWCCCSFMFISFGIFRWICSSCARSINVSCRWIWCGTRLLLLLHLKYDATEASGEKKIRKIDRCRVDSDGSEHSFEKSNLSADAKSFSKNFSGLNFSMPSAFGKSFVFSYYIFKSLA